MTIVGVDGTQRTFLQAVNRLCSEIGESNFVSVNTAIGTPTKRLDKAKEAVIDARDEVFYHVMWHWRRGQFEFDLVEGQMWYEAPGDWVDAAGPISMNRIDRSIEFMEFRDLIRLYPDIRSFTPGSGVGGIGSAFQLSEQSHNFGEPYHYTYLDGYVGLMPIPDEDFVDTEGTLYGQYWKQAGPLLTDEDDIGLPRELWFAHHKLATGYYKQYMMYRDFEADIAIGRKDLRRRGASMSSSQDMNRNHVPGPNYNE